MSKYVYDTDSDDFKKGCRQYMRELMRKYPDMSKRMKYICKKDIAESQKAEADDSIRSYQPDRSDT